MNATPCVKPRPAVWLSRALLPTLSAHFLHPNLGSTATCMTRWSFLFAVTVDLNYEDNINGHANFVLPSSIYIYIYTRLKHTGDRVCLNVHYFDIQYPCNNYNNDWKKNHNYIFNCETLKFFH